MGPKSKRKFHLCLMYTSYTWAVFLCNTFDNFVRETKFHGIDTWAIMVAHKNFQILDVWIMDVRVLSSKSKV